MPQKASQKLGEECEQLGIGRQPVNEIKTWSSELLPAQIL